MLSGPVAGLPWALPMWRTCSPGAASLSVGKAFDTGSTDLARPLPTASGGIARRGRRCPRHSGANAPECEGGKAVPAQADGPVRRPACRRHRHAAQRHEASSQSCARGKPPGAQGPEQQSRGLSPSNATTQENHGAVQVTPAGAGLSFRARPDRHPLPAPPLQTLFNVLPPRPLRRIPVVE